MEIRHKKDRNKVIERWKEGKRKKMWIIMKQRKKHRQQENKTKGGVV